MSILIYNITLQNTDFGVLQKSSKHFLIYIFFPPFTFRTFTPLQKIYKKLGLIFYNFVVKNVFRQYILFNIALQNTDFGVPQKSSKHFLISIFFPRPTPARYFVPRTMRTYFLQFCS